MSLFPNLTMVFLETITARLVPWFLAAAEGDLALARHTAKALIASFDAETEEEVRLATEITSFGFGVLQALSKSADPDLPLNAVLRLRGSANALQRSKHQCQRALDKLRRERRLSTVATEPRLEAVEYREQAIVLTPLTSVDPDPAQPEPAITLSRQQRRAMQRAVDKARRKHAEQARRDAMRAARAAPVVALLMSAPPGQTSIPQAMATAG